MNKLSKLGAIAILSLLPYQQLNAQTKDDLTNNLKQTEDTRGANNNEKATLTSNDFLTHLGVKITDPNEKKLIETVR
jgi:hypothetical protein